MTYLLQHANLNAAIGGPTWFAETLVDYAPGLPRIGETIELDGVSYEVIAIFHTIVRDSASRLVGNTTPTVRVK